MALNKDNLYWMISNIKINRKTKEAIVVVNGYFTKEEADNHKMQQKNKIVTLKGEFYPFVNGLTDINQMANVYVQLKKEDDYFKDAIDA